MDLWAALDRAHDALERTVDALAPSSWELPSTCDGWSVREVVQHVAGGAVRYRLLLLGGGEDVLAPTRTADHLGDDPAGAVTRLDTELVATARACDLAVPVRHPAGPRTGTQLLNLRVLEAGLHTWDIARGAGLADPLDRDVSAFLLDRLDDLGNVEGFFDPPGPADGGDPERTLLARTGRASPDRP